MFTGGGGGRGGAVCEPDGTVGAGDEGQGDQSHAVGPGSTGEAGQLAVANGQQLLQTPFYRHFILRYFVLIFSCNKVVMTLYFEFFLLTGILLFIHEILYFEINKKRKTNNLFQDFFLFPTNPDD